MAKFKGSTSRILTRFTTHLYHSDHLLQDDPVVRRVTATDMICAKNDNQIRGSVNLTANHEGASNKLYQKFPPNNPDSLSTLDSVGNKLDQLKPAIRDHEANQQQLKEKHHEAKIEMTKTFNTVLSRYPDDMSQKEALAQTRRQYANQEAVTTQLDALRVAEQSLVKKVIEIQHQIDSTPSPTGGYRGPGTSLSA